MRTLLRTTCVSVVSVLGVALLGFAPLSLSAQKAAKATPGLKIGAVNVDFGKFALMGGQAHFSAGVKMTSEQYDLAAEDVLAVFAPGKSGPSGLKRATATGSPIKKTQVDAHIRQDLSGEAFEIFADKAVYVPDGSRPGGGKINFTGRVKVISRSGFLAEPSVSTFDDTQPVTVLLGQGEDYPQLQTGPGRIIATPAQ